MAMRWEEGDLEVDRWGGCDEVWEREGEDLSVLGWKCADAGTWPVHRLYSVRALAGLRCNHRWHYSLLGPRVLPSALPQSGTRPAAGPTEPGREETGSTTNKCESSSG